MQPHVKIWSKPLQRDNVRFRWMLWTFVALKSWKLMNCSSVVLCDFYLWFLPCQTYITWWQFGFVDDNWNQTIKSQAPEIINMMSHHQSFANWGHFHEKWGEVLCWWCWGLMQPASAVKRGSLQMQPSTNHKSYSLMFYTVLFHPTSEKITSEI